MIIKKNDFIGRKINRMRIPVEDFSVQDVLDKISLRYSSQLHRIDWANIIDQSVPNINIHRRKMILHTSGQMSINPVLLLSKLIQDEREISHILMSDEEFRLSLKSFANDLSRYDQEFNAVNAKIEMTTLEHSLRKAYKENEKLMNEYLSICATILQRHDISAKTGTTKQFYQRDMFKRNDDDKIELQLPYSNTECWQAGATHFGALEMEENGSTNGKMSSIDFSPSLYQRWGVPFDYLFSRGEVFSANSGHYKKHSECSLEIQHENSGFSTYYSHLELSNISDGTFIEQGHYLGNISLDPDNSNCKCNWGQKSFQCATGPHVHLELRYDGQPESLDGRNISNLRIKTGSLPHDMYCSDPLDCTLATYQGKACATTFTLPNGDVICPVTKGSNIGTN